MLTTIDVHKGLLLKHLPEYTIVGEYPIGKGTWALVYKGSGKNGPVAIKVHELQHIPSSLISSKFSTKR
jgi:predicted Ser/Thr protein kinase